MKVELVLRVVGGLVGGLSAYQALSGLRDLAQMTQLELVLVYLAVTVSFGIAYLLTPSLTTRPFFWVRQRIYHASATDVLASGVGLGLGLLIGTLLALPLSALPGFVGNVLPIVASGVLGYFGIVTMLTHKQALLSLFGLVSKRAEPGGRGDGRVLLVDSSAIIDGRIAEIGRTGFLGATLLVPRFVLEEVQHVADSADAQRRARGRHGLEVLNRLQKDASCAIEISEMDAEHAVGVDSKLVRVAKTLSCPILTNDYNLNHVAQLQGVEVLNVNVLANAVRPSVLQGEELSIQIVQEGKEYGQGVGFLDDGTMVVVDNARPYVGSAVDVVVTRVLQTAAGRMFFARRRADPNGAYT
ncbi:MAG: PIN domain nuclease [Chloroflexi bacterium]|nr:PIN domain nuclease [Chloroflexota bacterium]